MRTALFFLGSTVGSIAFQATVALFPEQLQHYAWLVKYVWILWAVIWIVWLITHPSFVRRVLGITDPSAVVSSSPAPTQINVNPNISPVISPTFIVSSADMPPNRPKITFAEWNTQSQTFEFWQSGFYLDNHGDVALDVQVQRLQVSPKVFASSRTIASIAQGDRGFAWVWLEAFAPSDMAKWDLRAAMRKAADKKQGRAMYRPDYTVPVRVVYRDFDDQWYESVADLSYIPARDELRFGATRQRKITPPQ